MSSEANDKLAQPKEWASVYNISLIVGIPLMILLVTLNIKDLLPFSYWIGFMLVGMISLALAATIKVSISRGETGNDDVLDENAERLTSSFVIALWLGVLAAAFVIAFVVNGIVPIPTVFAVALALMVGAGVTYGVETALVSRLAK